MNKKKKYILTESHEPPTVEFITSDYFSVSNLAYTVQISMLEFVPYRVNAICTNDYRQTFIQNDLVRCLCTYLGKDLKCNVSVFIFNIM